MKIVAYYKFIALPDEVKKVHKIRSNARLDCIKFYPQISIVSNGLTNFVNAKGHLALFKIPARSIVNTHSKRIAEWSLTNNSLNFSSIYIEDIEFPEIGYGYPNAKRLLGNGKLNPLFKNRNDGYLFLMNYDYSEIELFIIPDGRNLINLYYQKMIDGDFDQEIKKLRNQARPFFNYGI